MNKNIPNTTGGQPTVGPSYDVDEGARLVFESWVPLRWQKRRQHPDIHLDYRIEVVEDGEPTGLHFQAQIKGRSVHKRKTNALSEPLKTKHLRYYLRCEEPVFVFLIDPRTKMGHWIFIQRYLREKVSSHSLRKQKKLAIRFDFQCSLENRDGFEKELRSAWAYMRDLHPGSPVAAILAKKKGLEELDSRFDVEIAATASSMKVEVKPRQPMQERLGLDFLKRLPAEDLKAFSEFGQEIQVKATDIQAQSFPILKSMLQEMGDAKIRIRNIQTFKGCLQFQFQSSRGGIVLIQTDGEWSLAPKRAFFKGQLSESPLYVELVIEEQPGQTIKSLPLKFKLDWNAWHRQPLLSLAYFSELNDFFHCTEFTIRHYVRGNQMWQTQTISVDESSREKVVGAIDWLTKAQRAARFLQINPPFPRAHTINANRVESKNVELMIKLIEVGSHEQSNASKEVSLEGDTPTEPIELGKKGLSASWTEQFRKVDFLGLEIPFGPIKHTWTDLELVALRPFSANRTELTFRGGPSSIWRLEYSKDGEVRSSAD